MLIISHENHFIVTIYYLTESLYLLLDYLIGISDASVVFCCCTIYIIPISFSILEPEELEREIAERRERFRSLEYERSQSLLIPQVGDKTWGEKRTFSKVDMVGEITGFRHKIGTKRDRHCMIKYLENVSSNRLNVPRFGDRRDFLPVGAPLLDYLENDISNSEGWKFPKVEDLRSFQSHRGLSWKMKDEVEVRELVCGVSSEPEIEGVHQWISEMHGLDQERFGSRVISLDVEDVKVSYHDCLRMAGKVQIENPGSPILSKPSRNVLNKYGKDEWRQIPGKIMFGNGLTWMAVISLDMRRNAKDEYILETMSVQQGILDLLRDLPVSAGLGIRRDVRGIEEFYSLFADTPLQLMNGFIDLAAMSIAAGFKFHARNMTALGVQVLGTILNKTVSTGDDMWGLKWDDIPTALQIYGIGDIKFGFIVYIVLAGILLRDLFPDPDVVCWYLKCEQEEVVKWFLDWLILSLEGVEFHADAESRAETREELLYSLRFRDARDKLCSTPPKYIVLWTRLIGSWPSITHGGCRFLIQCREWFMVQIRALARANIQWMDGRVLRVPTEADLEYARFGMTSEQIGFQSWTEPAPGAWGWIRPASITVPMIDLDPSTTLSKDIGRLCTRIQRFQRWAILEWARMNPFKIRAFFARMIRNSGFRIFYKSLYDALRLMYLRIFCESAPKVNRLEKELNDGVEKVYQEEKNALEKVEIEVSVRRERVAYMEEVRLDWKLKERTRWRERIPELPLWKRRGGATGKKRARSQSRSRSRVVKPKKMKFSGKMKSSSVLVPVQPAPSGVRSVSGDCPEDASGIKEKVGEGSGRPGVGISSAENPVRAGSVLDGYLSEKDDTRGMESPDEVIEDNLAESGSRVLLTTRRRKSRSRSGNRRTGPRRVLTHDELCEDLQRVIEEDEPIGLDGEEIVFEIPPEVEQYNFEF